MTPRPASHRAASTRRERQDERPDPYRWHALTMVSLFTVALPATILAIVLAEPAPPVPAWSVEAAALGVDRIEIATGELVYRSGPPMVEVTARA